MTDIAISVKDLRKKYRLFASSNDRLKEALHPLRRRYHREFWALDGVSFDVPSGNTFGIIGRNGSGKSTLLQVVCGILKPTSGSVDVRGRVSALLELGAGFNPAFTGRENVILNGAIMGFTRQEMLERLPEIEAFADIGEFINQPVRTYSSGMFVRLAFAAAINIDPDILVIDEALAVGDINFQRKCYNEITRLQEKKTTILFVSHQTDSITKHCHECIFMDNGKILFIGNPREAINKYWKACLNKRGNDDTHINSKQYENNPSKNNVTSLPNGNQKDKFWDPSISTDLCSERNSYNKHEVRYGDMRAEIVDFLLISEGKHNITSVKFDEWLEIYVKVFAQSPIISPNFGLKIKTIQGVIIFASNARIAGLKPKSLIAGECVIYRMDVKMNISPGEYFIDIGIGEKVASKEGTAVDRRYDLIKIKVVDGDGFDGIVKLEHHFTVSKLP